MKLINTGPAKRGLGCLIHLEWRRHLTTPHSPPTSITPKLSHTMKAVSGCEPSESKLTGNSAIIASMVAVATNIDIPCVVVVVGVEMSVVAVMKIMVIPQCY